jgi:hypothetical protein
MSGPANRAVDLGASPSLRLGARNQLGPVQAEAFWVADNCSDVIGSGRAAQARKVPFTGGRARLWP